MDDLWSADQKLLVEIGQQIEVDGLDFADLDAAFEKAGVELAAGDRSVGRLVRNGMLTGSATFSGEWVIDAVTEKGLREAGAWPSVDQLAAQFIAALAEAADSEPEPEKRSKLRAAASSVAEVGQKVVSDALAAYALRAAGIG